MLRPIRPSDPAAEGIERQIRRVWAVFGENPSAHTGAMVLESRLEEIVREIRELPVGYEEWQIVYRQALQLDPVLRGRPQLLAATMPKEETSKRSKEETPIRQARPDHSPSSS